MTTFYSWATQLKQFLIFVGHDWLWSIQDPQIVQNNVNKILAFYENKLFTMDWERIKSSSSKPIYFSLKAVVGIKEYFYFSVPIEVMSY